MKKFYAGAAIVAVGVAGLLTNAQAATPSTSTYTAPQVTNVRVGQGTNYAVFASVAAGATVTGVLQPSGWIQITSPAIDAGKYISSNVLKLKAAGASVTAPISTQPVATTQPVVGTTSGVAITGWVASSDHRINVRSGPGFNYAITSSIAPKSQVSGTLTGDWIKVAGGYINRGLIETTNANIFDLNGYVPTSSMCALPIAYNTPDPVSPNYTKATPRYLGCQASKALDSLEAAYFANFGHYALIDLTYRSHAEEVYWKNARPNAASPVGTSNHGWGLAIDFREIDDANGNEMATGEFYWGKAGYNWLAANASKYGFAGDPVYYGMSYESYHWNFAG